MKIFDKKTFSYCPVWFSKLLIFLLSLSISLCLFEFSLRCISPRPLDPPLEQQLDYAEKFYKKMQQHSTIMKVFDPLFHHSTSPNQTYEGELEGHPYRMTTNNEGCRSIENYSELKPDNVFRIALTGDSFTIGLYVDDSECYASQLQEMLKQKPFSKRWQLYNFGNVSYSPLLYWQQYTQLISKFHPDLLIIAIDNSDLQDDYYYEHDAIFDVDGRLKGFKDVHYSFFLGQVRDIGTPFERVETLKRKMTAPLSRFLGWSTSHLQIAVRLRDMVNRHQFKKGDIETDRFGHMRDGVDWSEHWKRSSEYLNKTVQAARKDGVKVLILFYPYPHQVNGEDWPNRESMGFELGKIYDTPMRQWLLEFSKREEIDYLDAFEGFRKSGIRNFSFKGDPHYLPNGHKLLADILCEYLIHHYNNKAAPRN